MTLSLKSKPWPTRHLPKTRVSNWNTKLQSHELSTKEKKKENAREISLSSCPGGSRRDGEDLARDPGLRRRVQAEPDRCVGGGAEGGGCGRGESGGGVGRAQGAGSGGREARAVGVPGVPRGGEGHLRQPPLAAARRPAHRHRRPRPRRARIPWPLLQAGETVRETASWIRLVRSMDPVHQMLIRY